MNFEELVRGVGIPPALMLAWVWLRWRRLPPSATPETGRTLLTVLSLVLLSSSVVSLCYLLTLDLLPASYASWMSERTWRVLWLVGLASSLVGGVIGPFG